MVTLDDLTPAERNQLGKLVAPGRWELPAPEPEEPSEHENGEEDWSGTGAREEADAGMSLPPLAAPSELLDLNTGDGWWRGHGCKLAPPALRKVQKLVVEAIATAAEEEIKRLRSEARGDEAP